MTVTLTTPDLTTVAPLLSLDQAKAGDIGTDVAAYVASVRARVQIGEDMRSISLYDAALGFHAVVVKGQNMTQGDYADALYGKVDSKGEVVKGSGKSMGTLLKRLARASVILGYDTSSPVWRYLVQKGTSSVAGKAIDLPAGKARKALASQAAEYHASGKVAGPGRTPQIASENTPTGTEPDADKGEDTTRITVTPEQQMATALDALDAAFKALPHSEREAFSKAEDRVNAILSRELTARAEKVTGSRGGRTTATPATVASRKATA